MRILRRQLLIAFGAGAIVTPLSALAQSGRTYRLGFLGPSSAAGSKTRVEALRAGLSALGYAEGKNLAIEFRWADDKYDQLAKLAAELVRLKVDIIVTHGTPGIRAAKQATTSIPIVMATAGDANIAGLVANISRPEANVTGLTFFNPELAAKRLEVLRDTFPRIKRIAVMQNPDNPVMTTVLAAMAQTAKALKMELQPVAVRSAPELESAFAAMAKNRAEALVVIEDATLNGNLKKIADLAIKHRLPAISLPEFAEAGALMAYGVDLVEMFIRAAYFVDRILKGAKIADLPVERAGKFELILNMQTAKAFGIKFPDSIKLRADRVIG
jgi:putative ABC transport system substrate-binding protein